MMNHKQEELAMKPNRIVRVLILLTIVGAMTALPAMATSPLAEVTFYVH